METYIQEKRSQRTNSDKSSKPRDILDFALLDPEYGSPALTSELIDQLKTFFFAGHDTTAAVISWAYYYLSRNPSTLSSLRAELDNVFGPQTTPADIATHFRETPKCHLKLEYTLAVVKEALRLEPPAATARTVPANYSFTTSSGAVYHPPENSMIYTSAWLLHRNKSVWGDDAWEFRPERFLPGASVPRGYTPFSKRPRDCIGSNLAFLEVRPKKGVWGANVDRRRLFWR
jgi:cytochrome P450